MASCVTAGLVWLVTTIYCLLLALLVDHGELFACCGRGPPYFAYAQDGRGSGSEDSDEDFNEEIAEIIHSGIIFPGKFDFDAAYEEAKKESETHLIWDIHHVDEKLLVRRLHEKMEKYLFKAYLDLRRTAAKLQGVPIVGNARLVHFLRGLLTRDRISTRKSDRELSGIFKERPRLFQWVPDDHTLSDDVMSHDEL